MEENLINNNTEPEVMEEMEAAEPEEEEEEALAACDNISPKQCQKLQFSIAQIMGFEPGAGEPQRAEDVKLEVGDAEEARPVKLWRPLAQPPPAAPVTALSPVFAADPAPAPAPAALALLRHYTLFR